jgi:hypothetical protein
MEARKLSDSPVTAAFGLSLRVRHPSIDPAEISNELQLQPEHSFRAGEPRTSGSGLKATALHAESYWLGALSPLATSFAAQEPSTGIEGLRTRAGQLLGLDAALSMCVTQLARRHAAFFNRIVAEGGQIGLLVELSPEEVRSFSIPPAIGRSLAELGITLEFEFESAG